MKKAGPSPAMRPRGWTKVAKLVDGGRRCDLFEPVFAALT